MKEGDAVKDYLVKFGDLVHKLKAQEPQFSNKTLTILLILWLPKAWEMCRTTVLNNGQKLTYDLVAQKIQLHDTMRRFNKEQEAANGQAFYVNWNSQKNACCDCRQVGTKEEMPRARSQADFEPTTSEEQLLQQLRRLREWKPSWPRRLWDQWTEPKRWEHCWKHCHCCPGLLSQPTFYC